MTVAFYRRDGSRPHPAPVQGFLLLANAAQARCLPPPTLTISRTGPGGWCMAQGGSEILTAPTAGLLGRRSAWGGQGRAPGDQPVCYSAVATLMSPNPLVPSSLRIGLVMMSL